MLILAGSNSSPGEVSGFAAVISTVLRVVQQRRQKVKRVVLPEFIDRAKSGMAIPHVAESEATKNK
jgi:hypothetical protein